MIMHNSYTPCGTRHHSRGFSLVELMVALVITLILLAGIGQIFLSSKKSYAIQDTLEKLDLVFLPDEAERPLILRFDPSLDAVLELSLSGEGVQFEGEEGLRRLRRLALAVLHRRGYRLLHPIVVRGGL